MKAKRLSWSVVLTLTALLLTSGCNGSKPSSSDSDVKKPSTSAVTQQVKQPEIPTDVDGMLTYDQTGKYSGKAYDQNAVDAELQKIPEHLSDTEAFAYVFHLVGESYKQYKETYDSFDPKFKEDLKTISAHQQQPGSSMHVEVILDSSGSMAESVPGGVKMDLAKKSIRDFLKGLPKGANVGLRVFGHKGTSADKDKELSCGCSELVYPISSYDEEKFNHALDQFHPSGWTAIADSLEKAKNDLASKQQDGAQNIIYLVTDGIETCNGDPVAKAKELQQSNIHAVVNVIGFNVNDQAQTQLQATARAGAGKYITVRDAQSLTSAFNQQKLELIQENNKWWTDAISRLSKNWTTYETLANTTYFNMLATLNQEHQRMMNAYQFLISKKLIAQNSTLNQLIQARFNTLDDYNNTESKDIQKKIQDQSNFDEVDKQFQDNDAQINK